MRTLLFLLVLLGVAGAEPDVGYARGQVHPDFELPRLDGGSGKLSDYRGKRILLFHFASW